MSDNHFISENCKPKLNKMSKKLGIKATYSFHGEIVQSFECFPTAVESSNEYNSCASGVLIPQGSNELQTNHSYSGTMDGGVLMPTLKNDGPYAGLVTAIKRAKQDSEAFFKGKVEGPDIDIT